ncbi:hypothetical protein AAY42_13915 [Flagellimonas eckloniae]|uniref:Alpha-L-glutamate ligase-related protein ATP-grasp domain-containing protein n=1 Tax=Flagellimonas eckloniae TaxID=346185 RepID=A0A0Q1BJK8_9FLAO|nr:hypothetical protein AAY42_13915 [Allomuricauda eckloniae]
MKKTDFKLLFQLIQHEKSISNNSGFSIVGRMILSFIKYDTAFINYFAYEFENKEFKEIKTYANSWFMYKFQRNMNNAKMIKFFKTKSLFYEKFKDFICHKYTILSKDAVPFNIWIEKNSPEYLICKTNKGQSGDKIIKVKVSVSETGEYLLDGVKLESFHKKLLRKNLTLIEEVIEPHPVLKSIHPDSLNTLRIVTQVVNPYQVDVIAATMKAGINHSVVDNSGKGGVDCSIDINNGKLIGPLSAFDPRKKISLGDNHPTTNMPIVGITIPHWKEAINTVKKAALVIPSVKSVGWDVAITKDGAFLLEGNHNWSSLIQKALGKGIKDILNSYRFPSQGKLKNQVQ